MGKQMRLVINALQYGHDNSGIGVCIRELFGRFAAEWKLPCTVILSKDSPEIPHNENTVIIRSPWNNGQKLRRMLFQSVKMGRYCRDALLLTTDSKVPLFIPHSCRVLPLVSDLALYRLPETYQKSRVLLWKAQYKLMKKHVAHWLTVSEFSKRDLMEILGVAPDDIDVVYDAAAENYSRVTGEAALEHVRRKYKLPDRYILFVGNFNPRKNLERILLAFDRLRERTDLTQKLVIAGGQGWKFDKNTALDRITHKEEILFVGFVPDDDMPALYSMADLFMFPTLYEGFGIPVIEAQRCGVPVLTSNVSALPEVAGGGAAYVDPCDAEMICRKMEEVLTDTELAKQLTECGYRNAERFSWDSSVQRLVKIVGGIVDDGLYKNI